MVRWLGTLVPLALVVWGTEPAAVPGFDVRLAEGPLATAHDELNAAFTPDRRSVYFTRKDSAGSGTIMVSRRLGERWSDPEVASFSGHYPDYDPFVTHDGKQILWISKRPIGSETRTDLDIWMAEWQGEGWGPARHFAAPVNSEAGEFFPSVARNGTLYFSSNRPGGSGRGDIYRARLEHGAYRTIERLGNVINSEAFEGDPYIAPDERYLIFTAWGRAAGDKEGDLFVSMNDNGRWSPARRLPEPINSAAQEYAPIVSPDGEWLYFASYRGGDDPRAGKGSVYRVPLREVLTTAKGAP
jgi:Tol biopolymer transport system component